MKHVVKQLCLIAFSSTVLLLSTNASAHEPCVKLRQQTCPHKIIRSVKSNQAEFNNKALCVCVADFTKLINQQLSEEEQQQLFNQVKQNYGMTEQTFLKLLLGR
ncbi:hypothetical protein ACMZOO_06115 [Catenovulum sp. SX2]|uniref:hypothetical protein n=1 Tax=Catenovulum sp. SX2 TaxID=3398614 RepID=UPI003F8779F4